MLHGLLENADVGLTQRRLELREDSLRFGAICAKEPLERVERELLDCHDGEGARPFPGPVPAHAVGDEKEMCAFLANLQRRFWQARLPDPHGFREFGDQELILIVRAHLSLVGNPKGLHRHRTV